MSGRAKSSASPAPSRRSKRGGHQGKPDQIVEAKPTTPASSEAATPPAPPGTAPAPGTPPRRAVLELMRDVQSGAVDPRNIGPDERRACVAYLTAEGYAVPEIAQILKTCDRTVHRDREKTRAENALRPSAGLVLQLVGQLATEAATAVQRLRRIGREKDAPHSARVDAERGAWLVYREFVQSMQRLGYLPMAVPSLHADVTHRVATLSGPSAGMGVVAGVESGVVVTGVTQIDEMHAELARIEEITRVMGLPSEGSSEGPGRTELTTGGEGRGGGTGMGTGIGASVRQARRALLLLEAGHHLESAKLAVESKSVDADRAADGPAQSS